MLLMLSRHFHKHTPLHKGGRTVYEDLFSSFNYVCVKEEYVYRCLQRPESLGPPGSGVTSGYKLSDVGANNQTQVL